MNIAFRTAIAGLLACAAAAPAQAALDLGQYAVTLQRGINFDEASGVTYNWDRNTLMIVDDEGDDLAEYSLTGERLTADRISGYRDIEGVAYIGGGAYVLAEERTEEIVRITPGATGTQNGLPSTQYTSKGSAQRYLINGGANIGNNGLEGVAFDPITGGFFSVRQGGGGGVTQAVYQSQVSFGAVTTGTTIQPFDAALLGVESLSDIATLSTNPNFAGTDYYENLLILSLGSRVLLEVTRTGDVLSRFDLAGLDIQTIEGVTIDHDGNIYLVGETGGSSPTFNGSLPVSTSGLVVLSRVSAVPEPAAWALMIGGFGLVGGTLRRRHAAVAIG